MILSVPENHHGRDFVVGDLHGCYSALQVLMAKVSFNRKKDRLFAVGDLCDRGDESQRCIELLKQPWFFAVRGNHEAMMLAWYYSGQQERQARQQSWCLEGGEWFFTVSPKLQDTYCQLVEQLPWAILIENQGIRYAVLHAEVSPEISKFEDFMMLLLEEEPSVLNACLRGRRRQRSHFQQPIAGIDYLLNGHTPGRFPQIWAGNTMRLDFGAGHAGKTTGLGMLELGRQRLFIRYADKLAEHDVTSRFTV